MGSNNNYIVSFLDRRITIRENNFIIPNDASDKTILLYNELTYENSDIIFIYSGTDTLYDYITALNNKGKGLDAAYLYKFKICYENKNLKISYSKKSEYRKEITSISNFNFLNQINQFLLFHVL